MANVTDCLIPLYCNLPGTHLLRTSEAQKRKTTYLNSLDAWVICVAQIFQTNAVYAIWKGYEHNCMQFKGGDHTETEANGYRSVWLFFTSQNVASGIRDAEE